MSILARQILVNSFVLACGMAASGCGQRGALYLPAEPAAAQRATLPETLNQALNPMANPPSPAPLPAPAPPAVPAPASQP